MRLKRYTWALLAIMFGSAVLSSCLNEENKIPANCYDGELNNEETDVDCGGPNCPDCPPSCYNGIWDVFPELGWVEVDTDCGGPCPACPSCDDGVMNGDETGIDCGGPDCLPCSAEAGDCTNNFMDGDETGIDCGGCCCPDCPDGAGDCTNDIQDGDEEGVDCGGSACAPCIESDFYFTDPDNGTIYFDFNTAVFNDGDLVITGMNTETNQTISFNIPEPMTGWENGLNFGFDVSNGGTQVCGYGDEDGVTFTSAHADADLSLFLSVIGTETGDEVVGTFSGVLVDPLTDTPIQVVNGVLTANVW